MALKTLQADHAVAATAGHRRPFGPVEGQAGQGADRGHEARPAAATTTAASPRATWAAATSARYRMVDFKRRKFDVRGDGRAPGVRPQPHGLHRADQVRGRRARLHPGAAAPEGGRRGRLGRARRHQAGQRHAAEQHAGRHHRPQRRDEARQGRPDARARPAPTSSSSARTRATRSSSSARAKCAWCRPSAWRPIGAVRNPDNQNIVDRQGRPQRAGWAAARSSAASP